MVSLSEEQTESIGRELAKKLRPGDIVWMRGGLGAGKTAFVRGLASGLGVCSRVTSPTFSIVNEYEGTPPLFHFDLYRLSGWDGLYEIGWDDYIRAGGICAVEWSERLKGGMEGYTVEITSISDSEREINITSPANEEVSL